MRALLIFLFFASVSFAKEFSSDAKLSLGANCILELQATKTNAVHKNPDEGIWGLIVYRHKLFMGTGGFPPYSILTKATLVLDGQRISLDTAGIGNPWIEKPYRPWYHWESNRGLGVLSAAFSDGAEIYIVRWHVFRGFSLKTEMRQIGDEEIPWVKDKQEAK